MVLRVHWLHTSHLHWLCHEGTWLSINGSILSLLSKKLRPTVLFLNASSKLALVRRLLCRVLSVIDPGALCSVMTRERLLGFPGISFWEWNCSRTGDENNSRFRGFKNDDIVIDLYTRCQIGRTGLVFVRKLWLRPDLWQQLTQKKVLLYVIIRDSKTGSKSSKSISQRQWSEIYKSLTFYLVAWSLSRAVEEESPGCEIYWRLISRVIPYHSTSKSSPHEHQRQLSRWTRSFQNIPVPQGVDSLNVASLTEMRLFHIPRLLAKLAKNKRG